MLIFEYIGVFLHLYNSLNMLLYDVYAITE